MKELKFNPYKERLRATFAIPETEEPRFGAVYAEKNELHSVQITLEGEAKGHGIWLDRAFCKAVAEQGNAMGDAGVKVRFGHPAMCSDALGTYLGRAKEFQCVDVVRKGTTDKCAGVVANVYLDEHADRREWILNMAKSAPDTFGQSIVFTYGDYKVKDSAGGEWFYSKEVSEPYDAWKKENPEAGGKECANKYSELQKVWMSKSADGRVFAVLGKLLGTDFTDSPAATDGVFGADDLASEAEDMLNEHPEILEAIDGNPDKVFEFLSRIGVLDRLESKRVAGIQAEKDREIGELKKVVAARDAMLANTVEASESEIVALKARIGELEAAKEELEKKNAELAEANARVEQLRSDLKAGETALAESREQLERLQEKHDALVGGALNAVRDEKKSYKSFAEAVDEIGYSAARAKYPELLKAYRVGK